MITVILCVLIAILIGGTLTGVLLERKDFNGGRCPHCEGELDNFDTDSQGGNGWTCRACHYYTWTSYPLRWLGGKKV